MTGLAAASLATTGHAQGQDGTRAERNAQIIGALLPGRFDNVNQVYFAKRLEDVGDQHHQRTHIEVMKPSENGLVSFDVRRFDSEGGLTGSDQFAVTLSPESDGRSVRMRFLVEESGALQPLDGCDMLWRLEAGQYRAKREGNACASDKKYLPTEIQLSDDDMWWSTSDQPATPIALERARSFSCYIDVPGVGGGRDIPYQRYEIPDIHDKGGQSWVTLQDGSELGVRLTNVRWPMNNLDGIFTRHSFVVYLSERSGGETREVAYSWTYPDAQRIGMNVKTALVNCFMLNNEEIEPFFREEPRL
ncbi:hypothetical protein ACRAQ7_06565 [Erythrobacter sp. W53]|uniref:hypothetical protein n=1 Tax=Erythrobacter sp. W53 TaxID=3425947 RepID=UPI003D76784C